MNVDYKIKYPFLLMLSMFFLTLGKIYYLYSVTFAPQKTVLALIRTSAALFTLYFIFIFNYIFFKRSFTMKLLFHELLAVIILADLLYFKYFNALPSAADLMLLPVIPSILDCIRELFKPVYLLLFADLIILIAFQSAWGNKTKPLPKSSKLYAKAAFMLILAIFLDSAIWGSDSSSKNFDSFGLVHLHGSQIRELLFNKESYTGNSLYIKSLEEVTQQYKKTPKHFGIGKGRNVIIIQVESLQGFVINRSYNNQEITPSLNNLIKQDTLYFDNYYHNIAKGGTSDAEFTTLNSLYPASDMPSYSKYSSKSLYGLPRILKDAGYSTIAFHGFTPEFWNREEMYPAMGFDSFISSGYFNKDEIIGWGISDKSFLKQVAEYLRKVKQQPVFAFIVTLTNHYPYSLPEEHKKLQLPKPQSTFIERYLQSVNYTDAALGEFINELKAKGLYENSIIAIYGDHHAISNRDPRLYNEMTKLLGYKYDDAVMTKVPLIIHIPNSGIVETISTVGGQLDFMPTMLNLLGIDKGNIRFYGQDLCNAKSGSASTQLLLPKGSFIDDEKVFIMSADGIFEHGSAWSRKTKKPIDLEQCRAGYERVLNEAEECSYILSNDKLLEIDTEVSTNPAPASSYDKFISRLLQIINEISK